VADRGVENAIDQAEVLRRFDLRAVHEVLSRAAGRPGAAVLKRVLAEYEGPTLTNRQVEERFFALWRDASVPQPEVNGWGTHGTRRAFENDRRRDRRLTLAGWTIVRFTWRDVERRPKEVRETLARLWEARSKRDRTPSLPVVRPHRTR
jgi:hypothetical protein